MNDLPKITRSAISRILHLEEQDRPDWELIGEICDSEIARINEDGLGDIINGLPYQFLEDYDIRRKDNVYGDHQREKIKHLLDNYTDIP